MKQVISVIILLLLDLLAIVLSIVLGYELRVALNGPLSLELHHNLSQYLTFSLLYIIPIMMLTYEGIYTQRRDFWQESYHVIRALIISLVLIFAILALSKNVELFSRLIIVFSIFFMMLFIPLFKNIGKKWLFKVGLWKKRARVYGCDILVHQEVFINSYLGYVDAKDAKADVVFINSKDLSSSERTELIAKALALKSEVIFIPAMEEFDLTQSAIDKLQNTQTNLISLFNRLDSKPRLFAKNLLDKVLLLIALPVLTPLLVYIAYKIRKSDPDGPILFQQERLGQDDKTFICYKFRSMYTNGDEILEKYLKENPQEIQNYEKYHKYENDPRVTPIGHLLRRTSLDELPQIFNILKGEMSFIGPRPYMPNEKEKIGAAVSDILRVKPGITGLWQVSGRSEVDFMERVDLDVWYIRNWSLWLDIVILFKTVKVVLFREGAY